MFLKKIFNKKSCVAACAGPKKIQKYRISKYNKKFCTFCQMAEFRLVSVSKITPFKVPVYFT